MVGWHHRLDGHKFEQAPEVGDGQGSLACCSPWGRKESETTEWLNWTEQGYLTIPYTEMNLMLQFWIPSLKITCTSNILYNVCWLVSFFFSPKLSIQILILSTLSIQILFIYLPKFSFSHSLYPYKYISLLIHLISI